ncbi:MAG TPA: PAS domain-containing protein, partial [Polyangiaceae bacterium]
MGTAQRILGVHELASVIDALREGIQVIDLEWRYVYLNAAAAAHGEKEPGELLGRTMMECYPGIDATEMFQTLRRCMVDHIEAALR